MGGRSTAGNSSDMVETRNEGRQIMENTERLEYETPVFEVYGTLSELTEYGNSSPGNDGKIYQNPPPPHEGSHPH